MRPIVWGVIWFSIGLVGWLYSNNLYEEPSSLHELGLITDFIIFFALIWILVFPIALTAEVIRWRRKRSVHHPERNRTQECPHLTGWNSKVNPSSNPTEPVKGQNKWLSLMKAALTKDKRGTPN